MSYEEVCKLVERQTGENLLSDQTIYNVVVDKALEVSKQIAQEVKSVPENIEMPTINPNVDMYPLNILRKDYVGCQDAPKWSCSAFWPINSARESI